ncbi:hypothetical protein Tco_1579947 [Tanacetum coccineum]
MHNKSRQLINLSPQANFRLIVGQLLVDHDISYALTATTDVPAVYIQQFWKIVRQVLNHNETIRFMVAKEEITYIVDMFRAILKLPVETPEQPFIPPADFDYIKPFFKILGCQESLEKVIAFFTKNLAQPWQTMFKVFNRCLTSRLTGHDQTKINVLQIFHTVINKVHVDYASLLWCDFLHNVQQKKNVIQYPRFNKLIIADIMEKYESVPKRIEEDYHTIKDDTPLVSVYTTKDVTVRGMLITNDLLTDAIKDTQAYMDYVKKFKRVDVPTIKPGLVKST